MKLGEFIKNNKSKRISIVSKVRDIDNRIVFEDIEMIPMKYWDAEVSGLTHIIHKDDDFISLELIAIIK